MSYNQPVVIPQDAHAPPAYPSINGVEYEMQQISLNDGNTYPANENYEKPLLAPVEPAATYYVPTAYIAPQQQHVLPQYAPTAPAPRGDAFVARVHSSTTHVHVEKWTSDAWKIYKRNFGTFCLGLVFTAFVSVVFLIIFAITLNGITGGNNNNNNNNNNNDNTAGPAFLLRAITNIETVAFQPHLMYFQSPQRRDNSGEDNGEDNGEVEHKGKHQSWKHGEESHGDNGGAVAFVIISMFVFYFLFILPMFEGFILAAFHGLQGSHVNFSHLFVGYNYLWPIFMKGSIILASSLIPVIGPVVKFYLSLGLMFFIPILFNHSELCRKKAMRLSFHVINKNLCQWLFFGVFAIFLNVLGFFAFGLGLFVTIPLSFILVAVAYADTIGLEGAVPLI